MADTPTTNSPANQKKSPTSFLFGFTAFASKAFSDSEPAMSPTSILDTKPFSVLKNSVWTEPNTPTRTGSSKFDGEGVGLGIVDSITDVTNKKLIVAKKPDNTKFAVFGSQLKMIQIPNQNDNTFSVDSPKSPMEFGIKTRNSQLGLVVSPNCSSGSPLNFNGSLSNAEMELSEDYTCVISRGGHVTKMTRIFDDIIVDSCVGDHPSVGDSYANKDVVQFESFLSFCYTCRKNLGQGKDIYMYRGEKGFCSDECRRVEMLMEERLEKHGAFGEDGVGSW